MKFSTAHTHNQAIGSGNNCSLLLQTRDGYRPGASFITFLHHHPCVSCHDLNNIGKDQSNNEVIVHSKSETFRAVERLCVQEMGTKEKIRTVM